MARRSLLKDHERSEIFCIPEDDENLIRHHTLSAVDLLEAEVRRRPPNLLGCAVQLCIMRYPGRLLETEERHPPACFGHRTIGRIDAGLYASD